jgi:hypothetical protein
MAVLQRILGDSLATLRLPVLAGLAALLIASALGFASLGGRVGLAGIGAVEAAAVVGLLRASSRGPRTR